MSQRQSPRERIVTDIDMAVALSIIRLQRLSKSANRRAKRLKFPYLMHSDVDFS